MQVQKLIFPGVVAGILFVILAAGSLKGTHRVAAQPVLLEQAAAAQQEDTRPCTLSAGYPEAVRQWCGWIEQYAADNHLEARLVSAVILRESAGKPDAYSKSGAVGLMQVMPRDGLAKNFQCPIGPCFADRPAMQELLDPEFNIAYGTRLLAQMIAHYGSLREGLMHYGPKDVGYSYADLILSTMNAH